MKKIALTSLIAMFAFAGAHAANVIDGNPLYMPKKGHFYSETALDTETRNVDRTAIIEEFGYGVTDRLTLAVAAQLDQEDWFKQTALDGFALGATYRFADFAKWKWDVLAQYTVAPVWGDGDGFLRGRFLEKDDTFYVWTVGVRGGYTAGDVTVAGHVVMDYTNTESFNWNKKNLTLRHVLRAGLDAQLLLNKDWNLVSGAEYTKDLDMYNETLGQWELTFGANYNIDATKYVGAYFSKEIQHTKAVSDGTWEVQDGFGMGVKFGIDF